MAAQRPYDTTAYRYPREQLVLALTLLLVLLVIILTATATFCASFLVVVAVVAFSYARNRSHHRALMEQARLVTEQSAPALAPIVAESVARLQAGPVHVFIAPGNSLNAYTFGLVYPKVVVLHSSLLQVMDVDELRFVLGHELGHVRRGTPGSIRWWAGWPASPVRLWPRSSWRWPSCGGTEPASTRPTGPGCWPAESLTKRSRRWSNWRRGRAL